MGTARFRSGGRGGMIITNAAFRRHDYGEYMLFLINGIIPIDPNIMTHLDDSPSLSVNKYYIFAHCDAVAVGRVLSFCRGLIPIIVSAMRELCR